MLTLDAVARLWYTGDSIDPDEVEDERVKSLLVSYYATQLDLDELADELEEYLRERTGISGEGDANITQQSNSSGLGFLN